MIVKFLSDLNKDFYRYYDNILNDKESNLKEIRDSRLEELWDHVIGYGDVEIIDVEENTYYQPEPIFEQSFEKEYSKIDEELKKIKALSRELNERLIELRNIIRIYLKIEWNKSKNGE